MRNTSPLSSFTFRKPPTPGLPAFEALLEQIDRPSLVADLKLDHVLVVNTRLLELTACTRQELCGQNFHSVFLNSDESWMNLLLEPDPDPINLPLKRRIGQPVDVQLTATVLDQTKKWVMITLETLETCKQRKAEEERQQRFWPALKELAVLPQQSEKLHILESALETGSTLMGAGLLVVYLGESKDYLLTRLAVYGDASFLPEQLSPQDMLSLQTPHVWAPRRRALSPLQQCARVGGLSYLATAPLGQANAWVGLIAAGGTGSQPPEKILSLLDILGATITSILQNQAFATALTNNQQASAVEQAIAANMQDKIQDGLILLTSDLRILDLNPAAEAILGYQASEVKGQPVPYILVGAGEPLPEFLVYQPGVAVQDMGSHRLFRRDGELFLADLKASPVYVNDNLERILVVIHDLTEEEQYREQSQKLEQRAVLGELNAIFAHEVRNPINNISTGLQVLALSLPEADPNQEVIDRMISDCERVADLMKSVLSFIKQMEYKMEPIQLNSVITRLLDRWRPTMAKYKIQPDIYFEQGTPPAEGDQRALEHVWNNLISNAIQAMNQNGGKLSIKIRPVTTSDGTARVEVSISDTGGGISEEIRERIFEPFFTTQSSGTGLGLAITKRIVTAHKGTIAVVSVPGGSVFQVQLPVSTKAVSTEETESRKQENA